MKSLIRMILTTTLLAFTSLEGGVFKKSQNEPSLEVILSKLHQQAKAHKLDPDFVKNICFAESSFNPKADSGHARGLMQVSHTAWRQVRSDSWDVAFNWSENIEAGVGYMAYCRDYLVKNKQFSYPKLAAAYRYGPFALKKVDFDLKRIAKCPNKTYKELFAGRVRKTI